MCCVWSKTLYKRIAMILKRSRGEKADGIRPAKRGVPRYLSGEGLVGIRTTAGKRIPHKGTPLRAAPYFRPDPVHGFLSRDPLAGRSNESHDPHYKPDDGILKGRRPQTQVLGSQTTLSLSAASSDSTV